MKRRGLFGMLAGLIAARPVAAAPGLASGGVVSTVPASLVGEAVYGETILPLTRFPTGRLGVSEHSRAAVKAELALLGDIAARYDGAVCMPIGEFRRFMASRHPALSQREMFAVPPQSLGPVEHSRIETAARTAMTEA